MVPAGCSSEPAVPLLAVLIAVYPAVAAAAVIGLILSVGVFARSWSRTNCRAGWLGHSGAARWSLLCGTTLLANGVAEAGAAAWLGWLHRLPAMPVRFVERADADNVVFIVVIGESSALGVPYEGWLSVGVIVERALERVIPSCRFRVEILAEKGATLEAMQVKLAGLRRRPERADRLLRAQRARVTLLVVEPRGFLRRRTLASMERGAARVACGSLSSAKARSREPGEAASWAYSRQFGRIRIGDWASGVYTGRRRAGFYRLSASTRSDRRGLRTDQLLADLDYPSRK